MKKFLASLLLLVASVSGPMLLAQNPQAAVGTPLSATNTKYNNGIGIGFAPSADSGLVLNVAAGTSFCSGARHAYTGGTLNLTASTTNYIFLNSSCVVSSNTSGYTTNIIPIGTAITGSSTISSITDDRTMFFIGGGSSSVAWGSITGTLSSQTDLQSALNAKAADGSNSDITSLHGLTTPLSVAQGGTGTTTPGLVQGTNIVITGSWPNQTISASGSGSAVWGSITGTLSAQTDLQSALNAKAADGSNSDITSLHGLTTPLSVSQGGTGTTTPGLVAGTNIGISGSWPNQTISSTSGTAPQAYYVFVGDSKWGDDTGVLGYVINITGGSYAAGVCSFTNSGSNNLSAGDWIFANGVLPFNSVPSPGSVLSTEYGVFQVTSTGLSSSAFQATCPHYSGSGSIGTGTIQQINGAVMPIFSKLPYVANGIFEVVDDDGGTAASMNTNYSTLVHQYSPTVTGKPGYMILAEGTNDLDSTCNVPNLETDTAQIWAQAHADGFVVMQLTISDANWNTSGAGCPPAHTDAVTFNTWLRAQGRTPEAAATIATTGQYWDFLVPAAELMPDISVDSPGLLASNGGFGPSGALLLSKYISDELQSGGTYWRGVPPCGLAGTYSSYVCAGSANTFSANQTISGAALIITGGGSSLTTTNPCTGCIVAQISSANISTPNGFNLFPGSGVSITNPTGNHIVIGLSGSSGAALLDQANTFTTGVQTIVTGSPNNRGLVLQGSSGFDSPTLPPIQICNGGGNTCTFPNPTPAGHAVFVACVTPSGGASDNLSNVYTTLINDGSWWQGSLAGSIITNTGTLTVACAGGVGGTVGLEYDNTVTLSVDGTVSIAHSSGTSPQTLPTITTTQNDLILTGYLGNDRNNTNADTPVPTATGFPNQVCSTDGATCSNGNSDVIVANAASLGATTVAPTWTYNTTNGNVQGKFFAIALKTTSASGQVSNLLQTYSSTSVLLFGIDAYGDIFNVPVLFANLNPSPVAGTRAVISDASGTPAWHGTASGSGTPSAATTYTVFYNGSSWLYQ